MANFTSMQFTFEHVNSGRSLTWYQLASAPVQSVSDEAAFLIVMGSASKIRFAEDLLKVELRTSFSGIQP